MTTKSNLLRKENKNFGDFLIMKKTKEKINLIWRNIHSSAAKKRFFHAKKILSNLAVLGFLATLVSCTCADPIAPKPDPSTESLVLGNMDEQNIVFFPENTVTFTRFVDFNILNFIIGRNSSSDITITSSPGADVAIVDTNNLNINLITGVVSGSLKLNQRLDFENPIDAGDSPTNNQYEIVNFNITTMNFNITTNSNADGFNTNFKLFVRITDAAVEPTKIEILIDSYHLATNNEIRGINEFYLYENVSKLHLYEDAKDPDPTTGNNANNFLSADLVTNPEVIGAVDPSSSIANLYDGDDSTSGFLTATPINNSSKTYHRLTLNFNEEVYISKLAIRGRQIGGYQGFIFIMRDENDNILYVQRANGPAAKASGTDATALSTYFLVPSYGDTRYPISDFDIKINNTNFDIAENTTNVILFDNFLVTRGYEYERGFVSFTQPGADFGKFNTDNAYFLYNELNGITFKLPPDAETTNDADSNNVYEVGMVTITNVDGGHTNFNLSVRVVNMPTTVSLSTNAIRVSVFSAESVVIADLTEAVVASNFENGLSLGRGTYTYELAGADADAFKTVGNALVRANNYDSTNYNLQIRYNTDGGGAFAELNVTVFVRGLFWEKIFIPQTEPSVIAFNRFSFQAVSLANNDIIMMGGRIIQAGRDRSILNDIWRSSDGGISWSQILTSGWPAITAFQALILPNNDILAMGGSTHSGLLNSIRLSSDGGTNWTQIPASGHWSRRNEFQAVVLNNNDILVMGGSDSLRHVNDIWRSSDGGTNWTQIPASGHWSRRSKFQAVVLSNNDILVMGGGFGSLRLNDIWRSSDGGTNWTQIPASGHWSRRSEFQAVVLPNNDILVMGGLDGILTNDNDIRGNGWLSTGTLNDTWLSSDGGISWIQVPNRGWENGKYSFQAIVQSSNNEENLVFILGGIQYHEVHTDGTQGYAAQSSSIGPTSTYRIRY